MSNIVTLGCFHFSSDWTYAESKKIDVDKYVFFEVDYRGECSWHVIGHWCDKNYNWYSEEISDHQVSNVVSLAEFIVKVNSLEPKRCRVSRFNNLHYYDSFYSELSELFKIISNKETKN